MNAEDKIIEKLLESLTYKINGKEVTREYFDEQALYYSVLTGRTHIKTTWDYEQEKLCCELLEKKEPVK